MKRQLSKIKISISKDQNCQIYCHILFQPFGIKTRGHPSLLTISIKENFYNSFQIYFDFQFLRISIFLLQILILKALWRVQMQLQTMVSMYCAILPTTKVLFLLSIFGRARILFNILSNPICKIYIFHFSYSNVTFLSANKY